MDYAEPVDRRLGRAVEETLYDFRALVVPEAAHDLAHRHVAGAENRVHSPVLVGVKVVLANREGDEAYAGLLVSKLEEEASAERAQLVVVRVDDVVEVGAVEDGAHPVLAVVEPSTDRLVVRHLLVLQGQTEPRASRGRHAPVHPRCKVAHGQDAGVIQDVRAEPAPIRYGAVKLKRTHLARQEVLSEHLPVRLPCAPFVGQRLSAVDEFLHVHRLLLLAQKGLALLLYRLRTEGAGEDGALLAHALLDLVLLVFHCLSRGGGGLTTSGGLRGRRGWSRSAATLTPTAPTAAEGYGAAVLFTVLLKDAAVPVHHGTGENLHLYLPKS